MWKVTDVELSAFSEFFLFSLCRFYFLITFQLSADWLEYAYNMYKDNETISRITFSQTSSLLGRALLFVRTFIIFLSVFLLRSLSLSLSFSVSFLSLNKNDCHCHSSWFNYLNLFLWVFIYFNDVMDWLWN